MAESLIELIKTLRERTGAGMMDCRSALVSCGNNLDKATDWLREKGLAKAAKKADRIAAEGLAIAKVCSKCGKIVVLEVNCETDFVANGEGFHKIVDEIASIILKNDVKTLEKAKELVTPIITEATVRMGEKFDLRRFEILEPSSAQKSAIYIHMGGKIAVAVILENADEAFAKSIAMHIAANNPQYINITDVPLEVKNHEYQVEVETAKNDPKLANKPENILKNILEGKINKYFSEMTLTAQPYLLDDSITVGQALVEKKAKVIKFVRYQVGEGIEKKQSDFANEVMNEINK